MFGKSMSGFGMGSSARMGGGGTASMNPMPSSRPSLQGGNQQYGGTASATMRGSAAGRSPTPQASQQQSSGIGPSSFFRVFQQPQQPSYGFGGGQVNSNRNQAQFGPKPNMGPAPGPQYNGSGIMGGRQQQIGKQLAPYQREIQQRMTPGSPTYGQQPQMQQPQQQQWQPRPYMPQRMGQPQGGMGIQPLNGGQDYAGMIDQFRRNQRGPTGLGGQGEWVNGQWTGPQ